MTPFLTYELLTPETADPVTIGITGQRGRTIPPFEAHNGVEIVTCAYPDYSIHSNTRVLWLRGDWLHRDHDSVNIPLADWPAVEQAIRELNEYYSPCVKTTGDKKEKDMKEDRYEFPISEWMFAVKEEEPRSYIIYRKKPKVKVEYCLHEGYKSQQYGQYHIVQFRVAGWDALKSIAFGTGDNVLLDKLECTSYARPHLYNGRLTIFIGLDARDKWSAPVLLPESIYSRLDEITKALENKANEVKG